MTFASLMDILFKTNQLQKICNDYKLMQRKLGDERAKRLKRRLDDMRAASCLEDLRTLPQTRCHELTGNRAGQLSVDLDHPYRLIFEVANEPLPAKDDGGLDWKNATIIKILEIANTHE